jgi:hypothetical protein
METFRRGPRPLACVRLTRLLSSGCHGLSGWGVFEEGIPLVQVFSVLSKFSPLARRQRECSRVHAVLATGSVLAVGSGRKASPRGPGISTKGGCRSEGKRQSCGSERNGRTVPSSPGATVVSNLETRVQRRTWNLSGPASPLIATTHPGSLTKAPMRGPELESGASRTPGAGAAPGGEGRIAERQGSRPIWSMAPRGSLISKEEGS